MLYENEIKKNMDPKYYAEIMKELITPITLSDEKEVNEVINNIETIIKENNLIFYKLELFSSVFGDFIYFKFKYGENKEIIKFIISFNNSSNTIDFSLPYQISYTSEDTLGEFWKEHKINKKYELKLRESKLIKSGLNYDYYYIGIKMWLLKYLPHISKGETLSTFSLRKLWKSYYKNRKEPYLQNNKLEIKKIYRKLSKNFKNNSFIEEYKIELDSYMNDFISLILNDNTDIELLESQKEIIEFLIYYPFYIIEKKEGIGGPRPHSLVHDKEKRVYERNIFQVFITSQFFKLDNFIKNNKEELDDRKIEILSELQNDNYQIYTVLEGI